MTAFIQAPVSIFLNPQRRSIPSLNFRSPPKPPRPIIPVQAVLPPSEIPPAQSTSPPLEPSYGIRRTSRGLELSLPGSPSGVHIDFVAGKTRHRRLFGGGASQDLARAVGVRKLRAPTVVDATAGLGHDAFVLASLGCRVVLVERNRLVAELLGDALSRAAESGDEGVVEICGRMGLVCGESEGFLDGLEEEAWPDVVYLDPMFPQRGKVAAVKKEIKVFQDVVGKDGDGAELLAVALRRAVERVVVKRPLKAASLADKKPNFCVRGKTIRYDVYLGTRHSG